MTDDEIQHLIEDATFDYTMGDNDAALAKLARATAAAPDSFPAWHALAEKPLDLPCLKMGIRMEKAALDRRLAARIHTMLEQGALEEVRRAVAETPDPSAPGLSGIGCAELAAHLRGELGFQEALGLWLANTKAYAKRQMTWFKRDTSIHWFGPGKTREMVALASGWLNLRPISG